MKILVTGGAGYLGTHCVDLLLAEGYDVTVYDNLLYTNSYTYDVKFVYGDVRDYEKLEKIIHDFDVVVWLACLTGEAASAFNEEATRQINFESVQWLVNNYKGKIVFPSTASVYGRNNNLLSEDTSEINPISLYGTTKYMAEQKVTKDAPNSLVFRLGTLGGFSSPLGKHGGLGPGRFRNDLVLNIWSVRAAQNLPLVVMGKDQFRPILNVLQVSESIIFGIKNNISGLYNLVEENMQLGDIAKKVVSVSGSTSEIVFNNLPFSDMRNYKIDGTKFSSLGCPIKHTIDDAILSINKLVSEKRISNLDDSTYNNGEHVKKLKIT